MVQSIRNNSIHPIYVKYKNKLVKVNIFNGIRPASIEDLPIIQNLEDNFASGDKVQLFTKKGKYFLYPPEQLSDKSLRFCRVINIQGNTLRLQTKEDEFRTCNITDVTDIISPHPLHEYQPGDYVIGRIIGEKGICLRKSVVVDGFAGNMKEVLERYRDD